MTATDSSHTLDDLLQTLTPLVAQRSLELVRAAHIAQQPGVALDATRFCQETRRFILRHAPYVRFLAVAA